MAASGCLPSLIKLRCDIGSSEKLHSLHPLAQALLLAPKCHLVRLFLWGSFLFHALNSSHVSQYGAFCFMHYCSSYMSQ
jgi:hypothetical protein